MSLHRTPRPLPSMAARSAGAAAATALALAAGALLALPCAAESIGSVAASSVSSAGSASVGSVSDSLRSSSSSSGGEARVAEGFYRVLAAAEVPGKPGLLELQLRPDAPEAATPGGAAADGLLWLRVPRAALGDRPLAAGDRVLARLRPYGVVFAHADAAREPFFLAVHDGWQRELGARALPL